MNSLDLMELGKFDFLNNKIQKFSIGDDFTINVENEPISNELMQLIEYKKEFGFNCLICDKRAVDLNADCGFGGMDILITIDDFWNFPVEISEGIYYDKIKDYTLTNDHGILTWLDLWKAIEKIVNIDHFGHFDIGDFNVIETCNNTNQVRVEVIADVWTKY